jgi:hypothetical protein
MLDLDVHSKSLKFKLKATKAITSGENHREPNEYRYTSVSVSNTLGLYTSFTLLVTQVKQVKQVKMKRRTLIDIDM